MPNKQLPCQTQGRLPSNGPIRSDPAIKILLHPWSFLRRVTPDRVLAFPVTDPSRKAASHDYSDPHTDVLLSGRPRGFRWAAYDGIHHARGMSVVQTSPKPTSSSLRRPA